MSTVTATTVNATTWKQRHGVPMRLADFIQANTPRILDALERVLARNPRHIGAMHYYIHATEASNTPERALPYADALAALAPGSGHLVHMPAHIYARVGRWHDAVQANLRALLAAALQQQQREVALFECAYMQRKRELGKPVPPPKVASLLPELAAAIKALGDDLPLFIGGKSMGGRVASMLGPHSKLRAIFAFGYPFHAPKKQQWRTEHFTALGCKLFIAQGERDAFGHRDEVAAQSWPQVSLKWLTDGDHDLKPRVKTGLTQSHLIAQAAQFCSRSIDEVLLANQ